jgi:hypothetical protein
MAYIFGDSFDLYAAVGDLTAGYWDGGSNFASLFSPGRFAGSQAAQMPAAAVVCAFKNSTANDALHHIVVAVRQQTALGAATSSAYFQFSDVAANQCAIVFRGDGAILLTTGAANGTTIATYTGAITANNVWFAFEFEVFISATAGYMNVRKNGSTSNDFTSATNLNTRAGSTNNYANRLSIGNLSGSFIHNFDDILWRSDASSVPWIGDVRCYTRLPVSDQSVQFAKSPTNFFAQTTSSVGAAGSYTTNQINAPNAFAAPTTGVVTSLSANVQAGVTGHMKLALYDATGAGGAPGNLLCQSAEITNPGSGVITLAVTAGPTVTKGVNYYVATWTDVAIGIMGAISQPGYRLTVTYTTTFPSTLAGATFLTINGGSQGMNVTPINATLVNEAQQDGTASYVYDSTVSHADFYGLGTLGATPPSAIIALTTRGFMEKSDAGTRTGAMQLKSGATTVAAPTLTLATGFQWTWRTDTVNPNGSVAWTTSTADAAQIGPLVVS